jgi:hypothetical protein
MPTVRASVSIVNDFPRITRQVNDLARAAVRAAAVEGAQAASAVAAQRSKSGAMANIRVSSVSGSPDGWESAFVSPVFYAWFQNYGTLGNRRKALKQAPRTNRTRAPGTGVQPLKFLDAGRRAGLAAMRLKIQQGLPR